MDIDRYNREVAELEAARVQAAQPPAPVPEYTRVLCRGCGHVATYTDRAHSCIKNMGRKTVYIPNVGKVTRNADPAYRKHAGSRAKRGV